MLSCVEEFTGASDAKSFEATVKKALSRLHDDSFRVLHKYLENTGNIGTGLM